LFTTDWMVCRNSHFSWSWSPWCRKLYLSRAARTFQQAAGVGISYFIRYPKSYYLSTELLKMSSNSLSNRYINPSSNVIQNETRSCVRSASAMQKYDRHWTCSTYVFLSGLSSLIYPCYRLQLSVLILILKQTREIEKNRHLEIEALLAAMSSQRGQEPNPSNAPMWLYSNHSCSG